MSRSRRGAEPDRKVNTMGQPLKVVTHDESNDPQHTADGETHVQVSHDETSHETTNIDGDTVTYRATSDETSSVQGSWPAEADKHVRELVADAIQEREQRENKRANARNFNRMMMLVGALVIGLFVVYSLTHGWWGAWGPVLAPYAFVITILLDASLAVYAYIKHY